MTSPRAIPGQEVAAILGLEYKNFLAKKKKGDIPIQALPYARNLYDRKVVEQYLDKLSGFVTPNEEKHDALADLLNG